MIAGSTAPRRALVRHADSLAHGAAAVAAAVKRVAPTRLRLRYWLTANPASIIWPDVASMVLRLDHLWRATCCEAFVREAGAAPYREWNFSPAGHWQAYDFSACRAGRRAAEVLLPAVDLGIPHPRAAVGTDNESQQALTEWMLTAEVDVPPGPLDIGVSLMAVDQHGRLDYWALAHGTGAPDFHDPHSWLARV